MAREKSFVSTYENACKVIAAATKVAESYKHVHFWEHPNENTFNARLCKELGMSPTPKSVLKILVVVDEWNVHKVLKALYKGTIKKVERKRQPIKPKGNFGSEVFL